MPESLRAPVRRYLLGKTRARLDQGSKLAQAALEFLPAEYLDLPTRVADVSLAEVGSFDEFLACVASSAVIVTTRLHVAILGHLLSIPTYLVEGHSPKFLGVYNFSLGNGSVRLVRWLSDKGRLELAS